jgi:hypothetical protein
MIALIRVKLRSPVVVRPGLPLCVHHSSYAVVPIRLRGRCSPNQTKKTSVPTTAQSHLCPNGLIATQPRVQFQQDITEKSWEAVSLGQGDGFEQVYQLLLSASRGFLQTL